MPAVKTFRWQEEFAKGGNKRLLKLIKTADGRMRDAAIKAARQAAKLIAALPEGGVGATARAAYYAQQRNLLFQAITSWWTDVGQTVYSMAKSSATAAVNAQEDLLNILLQGGTDVDLSDVVADSLLRSQNLALEDLRSRFLNDIDLSPNVYRNAAYMSGKIDDIVNTGIALGQSTREIADAVVDHINPKVPGGQRYAAQRLARTELNNAYHSTSIRSYMSSPWVMGVKWHLSGSHPKPDQCNDYAEEDHNGLGVGMFLPAEVPAKPHPMCFCFLAPVTPTPDQFMKSLMSGKYNCA